MHRLSLVVALVAAFLAAVAAPGPPAAVAAREWLPDGESRPVIVSASLAAPARHDRLLEADLVVDAVDDGEIRRFEYRWNRATLGSIRSTGVAHPTVSYASVLPETTYGLQVRAVDDHGWRSDWFPVWTGLTPPPPRLIVAGDSVASGYHRRWLLLGGPTCRDADLAYGRTVRDRLAERLPPAWRPVYVDVAWPGAGIGALLDGGIDSCGRRHEAQTSEIERLVDPATWNVVVVTAGIDSTNWGDVVLGLVRDTALSPTEEGDRAACEAAVRRRWDLPRRRAGIVAGIRAILTTLAGTNADVFWTSYYRIDGTRLAPAWVPIGAECAPEMARALDELHGVLRSGIGGSARWIDLSGTAVSIQGWAGWPHPDADGHRTVGRIVAGVIAAGA